MTEALLDTNVILRHLLQDHPEQSPASTALLARIESGELIGSLTPMAIDEIVWVLSGTTYGFGRDVIREALSAVLELPGLRVTDGPAVIRALQVYAEVNVDFIDAYHAALAQSAGGVIYSFDRDFDRIPGVSRRAPG